MDKSLSLHRLSKYKAPHDKDPGDAIERYKWNIKLSQSLYPCLSLTEVALRNHLDLGFSAKYGNDWLTGGTALLSDQQGQVAEAIANLTKYKKDVNKQNIIASLTFGFWPSLFSEAYRRQKVHSDLKIIKTAFPKIPSHFRNPEELSRITTNIRNFRNRVFHHEPIFNLRDLVQKVYDMENILGWMNDKVFDLKKELCNFEDVYWNQGLPADKYFAVVEYQPSKRADVLNFLIQEISLLTGSNPDSIKFQCDAILKNVLSNSYTIRVVIHKASIVGVLFLGKGSIENLIVTHDWKSMGIYKWLLDFAKERHPGSLFVYTLEKETDFENAIVTRGAKQIGSAKHPELNLSRKKFTL